MEICTNKQPQKCCAPCRSKYYKERYARRRDNPGYTSDKHKGAKAVSSTAVLRQKLRTIIYEHYENNPCSECGETRIPCLQLDHLRDKVLKVSSMVSQLVSPAVLLAEIAKCRVLCANCHAVHTAKQLRWYAWREQS